ncbi:glycerol-3-phosphate dehydrogenase/oxidase [Psychrobacter sp. FDAARGOS_221]|uniref:glycerol-3-phosphate dehydrogenase/oxidase n=1 Tax=Psychrobacter sp. FDAARGOS_221 TaxID=1975705 RepID=UPI000BB578ED|nr:glycerol-3-phosphate dehydrogenase/oxidase [Psychrobacter sp. FDAARGOS_221]PNK60784.1 glycerol-3-phosphate dehydrogenase/oxidase [Psychrobacter sp. FDAARGOS_221]
MTQTTQRQHALAPLSRSEPWDMLIIGGGITGAGIAREAARRGLDVLLVEQKDFAWGTSSRSSKMVHGGLRYIAVGDFKTTRLSVRERERLLHEASGLVNEMHYVMPHYKGKFPPPWIFNTLLRVYDKLAGKRYFKYFKKDAFLSLNTGIKQRKFLGASQFSDAVTDDSRLVMRVLDEATNDGTYAINYLQAQSLLTDEQGLVVGARLVDTSTNLSIGPKRANDTDSSSNDSDSNSADLNGIDSNTADHYEVSAKVVVNATGAWADTLRTQAASHNQSSTPSMQRNQIRPSRGSHLVINQERLPIDHAYTLLHPQDNRALFVFPWENRTVIGTTDLDHPDLDDNEVAITQAEVDYLLTGVNDLFEQANLTREDVISTWAGVRPLISEAGNGKRVSPSKEKRDHSVWLDNNLVTVSGGKLTTFRLIALDVMARCEPLLPASKMAHNTDTGHADSDAVFSNPTPHSEKFAQLSPELQHRLQGFYGRQLDTLLALAQPDELTYVSDSNTLWAELRFAARHEQVIHLDDLLLRRTRLGLIIPNGGLTPLISDRLQHICQQELGWSDEQWQQEVDRYRQLWQRYYFI